MLKSVSTDTFISCTKNYLVSLPEPYRALSLPDVSPSFLLSTNNSFCKPIHHRHHKDSNLSKNKPVTSFSHIPLENTWICRTTGVKFTLHLWQLWSRRVKYLTAFQSIQTICFRTTAASRGPKPVLPLTALHRCMCCWEDHTQFRMVIPVLIVWTARVDLPAKQHIKRS